MSSFHLNTEALEEIEENEFIYVETEDYEPTAHLVIYVDGEVDDGTHSHIEMDDNGNEVDAKITPYSVRFEILESTTEADLQINETNRKESRN